jgi:hypothetical protein
MGKIRIEQGEIFLNDRKVGTANKDLKYGYHPAVLVKVGEQQIYFEMDEPDLLAKIGDFAREHSI